MKQGELKVKLQKGLSLKMIRYKLFTNGKEANLNLQKILELSERAGVYVEKDRLGVRISQDEEGRSSLKDEQRAVLTNLGYMVQEIEE